MLDAVRSHETLLLNDEGIQSHFKHIIHSYFKIKKHTKNAFRRFWCALRLSTAFIIHPIPYDKKYNQNLLGYLYYSLIKALNTAHICRISVFLMLSGIHLGLLEGSQ